MQLSVEVRYNPDREGEMEKSSAISEQENNVLESNYIIKGSTES